MDNTRLLIAELDFGCSPEGVLVIREARWQRVIGVAMGFLVGIPASWAATVIALRFGDFGSALIFSIFAVVVLGGSIWLLHELSNASCYYAALDNKHFYRRRGPRRLETLDLKDLGEFGVHHAALDIENLISKKRITIMKNAYAPANVNTLARRMNLWRRTQAHERESSIASLSFIEADLARASANRQITRGLSLLGLYPILLVLTVKLRLFDAPAVTILLWGLYTCAGFLILIGGLVRRVSAKLKVQPVMISQKAI